MNIQEEKNIETVFRITFIIKASVFELSSLCVDRNICFPFSSQVEDDRICINFREECVCARMYAGDRGFAMNDAAQRIGLTAFDRN